ncbi:hypothetical protein OX459_08545 [Janthinobacterium sp. SUN026]|uniref:hypothetical protein n=1 Tax=Janthinobacterium sp. SUN026 TaxID=3002438 RepID=UPI0025B10BE1|nr:hypothetical protein [Janthinobacterium sp. SUN026]MDN2671436.1 hypothetical protein [Janthinobacterium sp. SUN026]
MKFSEKTTKFREYALWAGIGLSVAISFLVILAIFDIYGMRGKVKDIQTFLGGLAVLAASLYSFYASSAAAAETFRRNSQDDDEKKINIRMNMILIAETLRQQSHVRLYDLNQHTKKYKLNRIHFKRYAELIITIPEHAGKIWENIEIIPQDTQLQYLCLINFTTMLEQDRISGVASCTFLRDEYANLLARTEKTAEKMIINESVFSNMDYLNIESNTIDPTRISGILANINNASISFLKQMQESCDWNPERPPYPPNFTAHEYKAPSSKN